MDSILFENDYAKEKYVETMMKIEKMRKKYFKRLEMKNKFLTFCVFLFLKS